MNKSISKKLVLGLLGTIIFCAIIASFSWIHATNKRTSRSYTDVQWNQDIDYYVNRLSSVHPNAFRYISKADFNEEVHKLKKDLKKLSDNEILLRLNIITAKIKDGHTEIDIPYTEDIYPIGLEWFGKDLHMTYCDKNYEGLLGGKLISINGISVGDCIKRIEDLISSDNEYGINKNMPKYLTNPIVLQYKKIDSTKNVKFTFSLNGKVQDVEVNPINYKSLNTVHLLDNLMKQPLYMQNRDVFWYKYIQEDKILYFQYNVCFDSESINSPSVPDEVRQNHTNLPRLSNTTDKLFQVLKSEQPSKLIIDLRNNTGGVPSSLDSFIKGLESLIPVQDRKNVYFITSNKTFSAAVEISEKLKKYGASSVGEPTSNRIDFYGNSVQFQLPNTKHYLECSSQEVIVDNTNDTAFMPQFIVNQSFDDYMKGEDTIYNFIKTQPGSIKYLK